MPPRAATLAFSALLALALLPAAASPAPAAPVTPATLPASLADERAKLAPDDVPGRLRLAKLCQDQKLWAPMADLAREALALDPTSRTAYRFLLTYDENVPLPDNPDLPKPVQKELKEQFNRDFKTRNTPHFVLVYDTTDAFAASKGAHMEAAYDAFFFWFSMHKLRPALLTERMVVVLFASREDYLAYGRRVDGADLGWTAGYYSQRSNRSAFYDDATGPQATRAGDRLEVARQQLAELRTAIEDARRKGDRRMLLALTEARDNLLRRMQQAEMIVDNLVDQVNVTKTIHEAVHHLSFNTGIQTRLVHYPLWLSEGIACSFETADKSGARGPAITNRGRMNVIRKLYKDGQAERLLTVEQLLAGPEAFAVAATQPGRGEAAAVTPEAMDLFYAQGWTLVHFLYTHHRFAFEKYLVAYQSQPRGRALPPAVHRKLFTDAFGEVADVQKRYTKWLNEPGRAK